MNLDGEQFSDDFTAIYPLQRIPVKVLPTVNGHERQEGKSIKTLPTADVTGFES
jgi:hypothetical protein